jgi:prepilin-type N-terminal cleavage/methylation domain-containing protein
VVFHNLQTDTDSRYRSRSGFTLVEVVVAIALIGVGLSTTIGALTKFNAFASESRNATGAYAAAMNQIDAIQSDTPFNPAAGQIPAVLTLGIQTPEAVKIYEDAENNVVVTGTRTTTVADVSAGGPTLYHATVTVSYTYLNRNYTFSMETLRASD